MNRINRRLLNLETSSAFRAKTRSEPDRRAQLRDEILRHAEELGEDHAGEIRSELSELGPVGLCQAAVRGWLAEHGWAETDTYRFAGMMAAALEIRTDERQVHIARQQLVSFLLERFREGKARLR